MSMKASYFTLNGEILGQEAAGVRGDYLPDALGSVVSTVDQAKAVIHTARYKPYGADLATTGTSPAFGWVGTFGYRSTGLATSSHYVRARHYGSATGRWRSVDPLWPYEKAYIYVRGMAVGDIDPTGTRPSNSMFHSRCEGSIPKDILDGWKETMDQMCKAIADKDKLKAIEECLSKEGLPSAAFGSCMKNRCSQSNVIDCNDNEANRVVPYYCQCDHNVGMIMIPKECAFTKCSQKDGGDPGAIIIMYPLFFDEFQKVCLGEKPPGCGVGNPSDLPDSTFRTTLIHESLHACSKCKTDDPVKHKGPYNRAAQCIKKVLGMSK